MITFLIKTIVKKNYNKKLQILDLRHQKFHIKKLI